MAIQKLLLAYFVYRTEGSELGERLVCSQKYFTLK